MTKVYLDDDNVLKCTLTLPITLKCIEYHKEIISIIKLDIKRSLLKNVQKSSVLQYLNLSSVNDKYSLNFKQNIYITFILNFCKIVFHVMSDMDWKSNRKYNIAFGYLKSKQWNKAIHALLFEEVSKTSKKAFLSNFLKLYIYIGSISSLIHIWLNIIDIFCLHIFC